jgi:hypothetical protein
MLLLWHVSCLCACQSPSGRNSNSNIPFFKVKNTILYFKKGDVTVTVCTTWAGTVTWARPCYRLGFGVYIGWGLEIRDGANNVLGRTTEMDILRPPAK